MRETQYEGKFQRMYVVQGVEKVAKGMKIVLEEGLSQLERMQIGCVKLSGNTQTSSTRQV